MTVLPRDSDVIGAVLVLALVLVTAVARAYGF
jgi:hypothetical protein